MCTVGIGFYLPPAQPLKFSNKPAMEEMQSRSLCDINPVTNARGASNTATSPLVAVALPNVPIKSWVLVLFNVKPA